MITLASLTQTCSACPSQWEGQTTDGRYLYARYRWGFLRVSVANTIETAVFPAEEATDYETLYAETLGDEYDGVMTTRELLKHLREHLSYPGFKPSYTVARTVDEFGQERFFVENEDGDWVGESYLSHDLAAAEAQRLTTAIEP